MSLSSVWLDGRSPPVAGRRCQAHVSRLSQFHRIMGTPGYHSAVEYVCNQLQTIGVTDVTVETFLMDGEHAYGDWIAPVAWRPTAADLWVETPDHIRLCDFAETPICLHVGSQSTPAGGLVDELIDIGAGLIETDYAGLSVAGRIVLTRGNVRDVYDEAVRRRGARGIISDCMPWQAPGIGRSSLDQPDLVSYNKLAVRRRDIGNGAFSFGISARQGAYLRQRLRQGPVRIRALVDAQALVGQMEVVNALIPGVAPHAGEIVLVAHLCHPQPGANDNASGPALILELARTLLTAQRAGHLPMLRHNLRLLFVPEAYGPIAWLLASQRPRGPMRLALNLDMVGGDSAQTRGHVWLDQTPWSAPTYLNDLIAALLADVAAASPDEWRYGVREHMGGSDHILFLAPEFGVPAIMLGHEPDRFYHSDQDTVDKTSATEFERIGQVVLAALRLVDNVDLSTARRLTHLVYHAAHTRLLEFSQRLIQSGLTGQTLYVDDHADALRALLDKEIAALESVATLLADATLPQAVAQEPPVVHSTLREGRSSKTLETEITYLIERLVFATDIQQEIIIRAIGSGQRRPPFSRSNVVPRRLYQGPISSHLMGLSRFFETLGAGADFYRQRSQEDRAFVRWMFEASNLIDGRHTLDQMQTILTAEFGDGTASVDNLLRFVDDLVATQMAILE